MVGGREFWAMVRGDLASQRVREPPRPTVPPGRGSRSALLLPQVFDGDVAPQKSVFHDLEFGLETIELSSVVVEAVGGTGTTEEGKETEEHAENLGDIGHTQFQLPW